MKPTCSRVISALFCLFLGGMLLWHLVLPDREFSPVENRTLARWPEFSWTALKSGEFTEAVEEYFADQFPLRDQWTGVKARTEQFLGKRSFHGVYLCGDTLISKIEPPGEGRDRTNLGYVERLAENTDIPVYLGLIPTAAEIWREKLPKGAESWDQRPLLEAASELENVRPIDFLSALETHAGEAVFYRTDHHWTTLGAFYGANALLEALGRETLDAADFSPETVTEDFCGTLYSTSGVHWLKPDEMAFWVPEKETLSVTSWRTGKPVEASLYDRSCLEEKDKYSAFLGGNQPLCVIRNQEGTGRLLLIRDSYADAMAPFLALRYEEVHLMDLRYYRASPARYAEENGIGQIAAVYSVQNFITDRNAVLLGQA